MPKNHDFEKIVKCTQELSFSTNCNSVKSNHQNFGCFLPVCYISQDLTLNFLINLFVDLDN